jgi:hypothetical protein
VRSHVAPEGRSPRGGSGSGDGDKISSREGFLHAPTEIFYKFFAYLQKWRPR